MTATESLIKENAVESHKTMKEETFTKEIDKSSDFVLPLPMTAIESLMKENRWTSRNDKSHGSDGLSNLNSHLSIIFCY